MPPKPKPKQQNSAVVKPNSPLSFVEFFERFTSSGAGFELVKYFRMEDLLIFASTSKKIFEQMKSLIKKEKATFKKWKKNKSVSGIEDNTSHPLTRIPIVQDDDFEEICDENPTNFKAWKNLRDSLAPRFAECHLSATLSRGPDDFIRRAIFLHPEGDRFIISEMTGDSEECWEEEFETIGWTQKIDYVDTKGELLVSLVTNTEFPIVNTKKFRFVQSTGCNTFFADVGEGHIWELKPEQMKKTILKDLKKLPNEFSYLYTEEENEKGSDAESSGQGEEREDDVPEKDEKGEESEEEEKSEEEVVAPKKPAKESAPKTETKPKPKAEDSESEEEEESPNIINSVKKTEKALEKEPKKAKNAKDQDKKVTKEASIATTQSRSLSHQFKEISAAPDTPSRKLRVRNKKADD